MKKTEIIIGQIQINDLRANSNLLQGDNIVRGWRSHSKTNYCLGRVNGDANLVSCRLNYLSDPDCIDMQVQQKSETVQHSNGDLPNTNFDS
jgi:hypothetical protein